MTTEERRLKKNQESLESYNWYKPTMFVCDAIMPQR